MAEVKKIPERSEIAQKDKWALEDIYATDADWEADLKIYQSAIPEMAAYAGRLSESPAVLLNYMVRSEENMLITEKLANYAMCRSNEDTRVSAYQDMMGRFTSAYVTMSSATSFEIPEFLSISQETMEEFYAAEPKLERYRRYLTDIRRTKDHVLSPAEEKLLAAAGEVSNSPTNIFTMFSDADLTFPDAVDAEGNAHPLSSGTFVAYESTADRTLRKSAYENLYDTLGKFRNTLASTLNAQMKQLQFFADARRYPSPLDAALDGNNVPTSVYLNLIEAVHQNLDKMHRYVRLRKKLLGVDELHFYDVYAQLVPGADKEIPYEEAVQTVYDALAPLGKEYQAVLKHGFDNRWVDIYENKGKTSGAYSTGGIGLHPYVLMNYNGTLDAQFTLCHEMGHSLHSYLSNEHQNPIDANYVIFVAEVASTCNEALLMEYLLGKTTDKKERAYLINHFLEQFKGTLYRQAMFAEFELNIGRMNQQGITLTADVLCQEYKRLNEMYFGPDMVVDDRIAMEWSRIPHFYGNYYVFQYATGYAAAIALSRRILREGEQAVKDYLGFLSGGCSKSPIDLLKGAGVDMTSPEPVSQALSLFDELLDEMEQLMQE